MVLLIAVLMISAFVGAQLMTTVKAAGYTEYTGTLNGAHFVVRFPDPWNGMLTILCRGYSSTPVLDARTSTYNSSATPQLNKGYALAASTYGAGGYCVSKAVNATYELTRYLVDTYHITGKVFLFGMGMGSGVALLLAEKYPDLYSGVLEISGSADAKLRYSYAATIANMTVPQIRSYLNVSPITPDAVLQAIKYLEGNVTQDIIAEMGGTPEEKPKAYEDRSPTYHANITIPVISIHSSGDLVVPLSIITAYQTAVVNAGRSSLYRLYITPPNVPGIGHLDANVQAQVGPRWDELYALSEELRPTPRASAFCNVTVMPGWTWYFFAHSNGGIGSHSYQWYEGLTLLAGQTSMVLPVTKTAPGIYTFYCKVTDSEGTSTNSNTVTLTVLG